MLLQGYTKNLQLTDSTFGHKGQNGQKGTPWARFGHTPETEPLSFCLPPCCDNRTPSQKRAAGASAMWRPEVLSQKKGLRQAVTANPKRKVACVQRYRAGHKKSPLCLDLDGHSGPEDKAAFTL